MELDACLQVPGRLFPFPRDQGHIFSVSIPVLGTRTYLGISPTYQNSTEKKYVGDERDLFFFTDASMQVASARSGLTRRISRLLYNGVWRLGDRIVSQVLRWAYTAHSVLAALTAIDRFSFSFLAFNCTISRSDPSVSSLF